MTDLSWVQYISNPYAVIAVIAAVLGVSFRLVLKSANQGRPGFILAMYAMFLLSITSLGLGVIAISFILTGRGASDSVSAEHTLPFTFIPEVSAQVEQPTATGGWLWAGRVQQVIQEEVSQQPPTLGSKVVSDVALDAERTIEDSHLTEEHELVVTIEQANLRDSPPRWTFWSWFAMHYIKGELLMILQPDTTLKVLDKLVVGEQLWLHVEVL